MNLSKKLRWPQVYNEVKEYEKIPSSQYLRLWNLHSKLYLVSCFYASRLMIGFEDLILIFYIWAPNLKIKVIMKNNIS